MDALPQTMTCQPGETHIQKNLLVWYSVVCVFVFFWCMKGYVSSCAPPPSHIHTHTHHLSIQWTVHKPPPTHTHTRILVPFASVVMVIGSLCVLICPPTRSYHLMALTAPPTPPTPTHAKSADWPFVHGKVHTTHVPFAHGKTALLSDTLFNHRPLPGPLLAFGLGSSVPFDPTPDRINAYS